uniref:NADH-ubiquinone oxidoreductase chain 6 n=1 Tax=Diptera sp. 53 LC-2017 TaxID=2030330 RepID=A0A2D1CPZ7_9DIPT|nr:NADH dehydrogenase subunit 6 [Diptera sp. 53 LC-2017]
MFIMMMMMMMNILFLNLNNPLIMGLILMIQTMLITIFFGKMNFSFWFSYIIFLIFIGGMLILFIYIISLINLKLFYIINYKNLLFLLIMLMMMFMYFFYNNKIMMINNYEMINFSKKLMLNENLMNLIKLYNFPNLFINLLLIIYLFIMMIICTNITIFLNGPFSNFYKN